MIDCGKLKDWLEEFVDTFHDVIASVTNESDEWNKVFFDDMDGFKNKLLFLCNYEE